nr:uncharacterized protein LOC109191526 [Ipomoea batatas]
MKQEEGYDLTWISVERKSDKTPCQGKASKKRTGRPRKHSVSKGSHFFSGTGEAEILKPTASQSLNSIEDSNTRESRAEDFGSVERKSDKTPCQGKASKKRTGRPPKHSVCMGSDFSSGITSYDNAENKHKEQKTLAVVDGCAKLGEKLQLAETSQGR